MPDARELFERMRIDDLRNPEHAELAHLLGMEVFRRLVIRYEGCDLYIPKIESLTLPIRDELILKEFNGNNSMQLARKWGVSERRIRELTKSVRTDLKMQPINGQTTFSDLF